MMEQLHGSKVLTISDRIYRLFLLAYPTDFRRDFGPHMAQVFRDSCRDAYQQGGAPGVLYLWMPTILDLIATALEEHILGRFHLSRSRVIRGSGLAILIASALGIGAIVSIQSKFSPSWDNLSSDLYVIYRYAEYLFILAGLVLVVGLIGLLVSYGGRAGSLGRAGLVVSVIGLGVGGSSISAVYFLNLGQPWRMWAWYGYGLGCLLLHLGMALFGLAAMQKKILSRCNALPFIVGLPIPVIVAASGWTIDDFPFVGLGWILLGYIFFSEASQQALPA